jgi:Ca2+-transporting ATPase
MQNQLDSLFDPKNLELYQSLGGFKGISHTLGSHLPSGLSSSQVLRNRESYGSNTFPQPRKVSFFGFVLMALNDKMLLVLLVAALLEVGVGIYKAFFKTEKNTLALLDGAVIIFAVSFIVLLNAISNHRKQGQIEILTSFGKSLTVFKVRREDQSSQLSSEEIVVGDVLSIQTGVVLPVDGILIQGHGISCDESAMTGGKRERERDDP